MQWVNADPARVQKYGNALKDIDEVESGAKTPSEEVTLLTESVYTIGPISVLSRFVQSYSRDIQAGKDPAESVNRAIEAAAGAFKDFNEPLEKKMAVRMLEFYRENAKPENYLNEIGDYASMDFQAYVDDLFDKTAFASEKKLRAQAGKTYEEIVSDDPAALLQTAIVNKAVAKYPAMYAGEEKEAAAQTAFTAGLLEWNKGQASYPDANSTMRLTYGTVGGYAPKDGVVYKHYTTLDGVMEKEDPNDYEFHVPARLKELWKAKDFGQYAWNGSVPTCFLTNNDITGGNSGSPVLNAKGELIGLAFDGNWESMSSDVMFEPDLQRCICVDIRYVLFMMDKFGGAGYLLDEMNLVRK